MAGRRWTENELKQALMLYFQTSSNRISSRNPGIIALANKLDRTSSSVSYKLFNFQAIDPQVEQRGLPHGSQLDQKVWDWCHANWQDFFEQPEQLEETPINEIQETEQPYMAKARIGQQNIARMTYANYDNQCCITGLPIKKLLTASHIIPWTVRVDTRLNPKNVICLNALHDRAFDRGLITLNEQYKVIVSSELAAQTDKRGTGFLLRYHGKSMQRPERDLPEQEFLDYHRANVFIQ